MIVSSPPSGVAVVLDLIDAARLYWAVGASYEVGLDRAIEQLSLRLLGDGVEIQLVSAFQEECHNHRDALLHDLAAIFASEGSHAHSR